MKAHYIKGSLFQSPLPPLPPSPNPSTPVAMSVKASSSLNSYSAEDMLTEEEDEDCVFDFPRERLNIVDNFGCGYFGDIHICELDRCPGSEKVFRNTNTDLVIVKSLRPGSSETLRFGNKLVFLSIFLYN